MTEPPVEIETIDCTLCDWWFPLELPSGPVLATAWIEVLAVHHLLSHPAKVYAETGVSVEALLAVRAKRLGPVLFKLVTEMATR